VRAQRLDQRQLVVIAAALGVATLAAPLLDAKPIAGVGLIAAIVFVALAFAHPVVALSAWVTLVFLSGVPGTHGAGNNYALLVVAIAWIGALVSGRAHLPDYLRSQPRQAACVAGLVLWPLLTLAWAPHPGHAGSTIRDLVICAVVFAMVVTLPRRAEHVRWIALGFAAGCTLSVLFGAASGGLQPTDTFATVGSEEGRLTGGGQDANYLAAAIVPALVLAAGLAAQRGRPLLRLGLAACVAILGVGLAATESRGGFLAAIVVCLGALVLLRGHRAQVGAFVLVLAVAIAGWFTVSPGSWDRVTSVSDGGSGRTDIWHVAERVGRDHPFVGVGLDQFPVVSPKYLELPGQVARGDLIVSQRIVVHNLYLQTWVELGAVGLLLLFGVAAGSLYAAARAAKRWERAGDEALTALARAVALAIAGALTASIFLSNLDDRRLWVLLGLGPALLLVSPRAQEPR
jgi:O-antigen ligase